MVAEVAHEGPVRLAPEAVHAVLDVGEEALPGLLPVVADVDPDLELRPHHFGRGGRHGAVQLGRGHVLAPAAPAVQDRPARGAGAGCRGASRADAYRCAARSQPSRAPRAGAGVDELDEHAVGVAHRGHGHRPAGGGLRDAAHLG